ncbi:MAG: hypothetical protein HY877_04960 [Deltaproteobacteria bacterium]|nr:hypothetical protein [Deltaproteobacteria bacterium]
MKVSNASHKPTEQVATPVPNPTQPDISSNPEEVLSSLKTKHKLFTQLSSEGLIHKDHLPMGEKLKETIAELEGLISKLKETV